MNKKFNIIFFDKNNNYIKTIKSSYVKNSPQIKYKINLGASFCVIDFNLNFDKSKTELPLDFLNIVEIWELDKNNKNGVLIFSGIISQKNPILSKGIENVKVFFLGIGAVLGRSNYVDLNHNDITITTENHKTALENILLNFDQKYSSIITASTIQDDGITISYEFKNKKWKDAINDIRELSGGGYFWRVNASRHFEFKKINLVADHVFHRGRDIDFMNKKDKIETIQNSVKIIYDGGTEYLENTQSINDYGECFVLIEDQNIKDSQTAQQRASQILAENKDLDYSFSVRINSNYNLESLQVGDTCQILGGLIDANIYPDLLQIVEIDYQVDFAVLTFGKIRDDLGETIVKLIN